MLTPEEKAELESLRKDPYVKLATKSLKKPTDPEKKRLYQYRWLKKRGEPFLREWTAKIAKKRNESQFFVVFKTPAFIPRSA